MCEKKEISDKKLICDFDINDLFANKTIKEIQSLLESYIQEFEEHHIDFIPGSLRFNMEIDYYDSMHDLFISYKRLETEKEVADREKAEYARIQSKAATKRRQGQRKLNEKEQMMKKYNLVEAK